MKSIFLVILLSTVFFSCNNSDDSDKFEDPEIVLEEIKLISKSVVCDDASEWEIINFGYSQCGFKNQTIAFHSSIDREELVSKIESYTEAEQRRIQNQSGGEIECVSIPRRNILINTFNVVECVSGESNINTKSVFENEALLGKWELSLARNKKWEEVKIEEKTLFFKDNGDYNLEKLDCNGIGNYSYEETKGVVLGSSNCSNNNAFIFIYDFDSLILELEYNNDSEIIFESYNKIID